MAQTQTPALKFQDEDDVIDYTPASAVYSGDVVVIGSIPFVASVDIAANVKGSLATEGVWKLPKDTSTFSAGDAVYWNATGSPVTGTASTGAATSTASGANLAGMATLSALTGDTYVYVLLTAAKRTTTLGGAVTADSVTGTSSTLPVAGLASTQGGSASAGRGRVFDLRQRGRGRPRHRGRRGRHGRRRGGDDRPVPRAARPPGPAGPHHDRRGRDGRQRDRRGGRPDRRGGPGVGGWRGRGHDRRGRRADRGRRGHHDHVRGRRRDVRGAGRHQHRVRFGHVRERRGRHDHRRQRGRRHELRREHQPRPRDAVSTGIPGEVQVNSVAGTFEVTYTAPLMTTAVPASGTAQPIYIATRAMRLKKAYCSVVTHGTSETIQLTKDASAAAPGAGTAMLAAVMTPAANNTPVTQAASSTIATATLAAGDRISFLTGGTIGGRGADDHHAVRPLLTSPGVAMEPKLYELLGRKQQVIEEQDAAYSALLGLLAGVVGGEVARERVTVNLTARTWAMAPDGSRPEPPAEPTEG
jgi:predicted RecA/RadA family phage recombinase